MNLLRSPEQIFEYAARHNIRLAAENGKLILESQDGDIPEALVTSATQHKPAILKVLSSDSTANDKSLENIYRWLDHIGETDPVVITDLLNRCERDPATKAFCLSEAAKSPVKPELRAVKHVTCRECIHFHRIEHLHLGHCAMGKPENPSGLWDDTPRGCDAFSQKNIN